MEKIEIRGKAETRARSRLYPRYHLEEVLNFINYLNRLGGNKVSAASLAAELGKSVTNSSFTGRLSSARQFGLVEQDGSLLSLSSLSREIIYPTELSSKDEAIKSAFINPPLYKQLVHTFSGKIIPEVSTLGNRLVHDYGIEPTAKDLAAKNFVRSSEFAKVIINGILILEGRASKENNNFQNPTEFQQRINSKQEGYSRHDNFVFSFSNITLAIPNTEKVSEAIADGQLKQIKSLLQDFAAKYLPTEQKSNYDND